MCARTPGKYFLASVTGFISLVALARFSPVSAACLFYSALNLGLAMKAIDLDSDEKRLRDYPLYH